MPTEVDYLLLGGGLASATAAATLRLEGAKGSIMILSNEELPPYYRPPLSKQFLLGAATAEMLSIYSDSFYKEQEIELALNVSAIAVNTETRHVTTDTCGDIRYGQLLIATGGRPKPLEIPGTDLKSIHYLRRKAECEAIRQNARSGAKSAVVIGASFLGMEIAMSLIALGLHVTLIEADDKVLKHLESTDISEYFKGHAESQGASVLLRDTPLAFHGEGGQVREVETASGHRVPCDLAVISIGVVPNTEFLQGSGIVLDEGLVVVDELLRSNVANVFAAGDVTSFYDPVFALRRHIEHWDNAVKQGRLAAKNMLDQRLRYDEVSYFFCDVGDISFSVLGAPEEGNEQFSRGALDKRSLAIFYLKDGVPRALFSIGRPVEETRHAEDLIRYRVNLGDVQDRLSDQTFSLAQIPISTVLILQGGGALGAFEWGVVKALEEEQIFPDIVAGVSIGALNGAIIAANPRHATEALESFWSDLSVRTPFLPPGEASRAITSMEILMFGVPNFFKPRWLQPFANPSLLPADWTSYYDTAPMKELISKYVDFPTLKASPVRLLVGAVNVATAELEIFDSYVDDLTPNHILASGSLPPGFPWTVIDGEAYWDGGIVSNSPLDLVLDRCGPGGKHVFIVDLFAGHRDLPKNMMEVMSRRDEIFYSERIRSDRRLRETVASYRTLVNLILAQVDPYKLTKIQQRPLYIEMMGDGALVNFTRFVRESANGEPSSRDYDFSEESIRLNQAAGYALAKKTLHHPVGNVEGLTAASPLPVLLPVQTRQTSPRKRTGPM
ncbi:FAD-dependent oxidoreductase [Acidocella aminolytica]|uniref:FAD dependent pyridine nucleotide-disulfide oxidoreductase n=1 Tax=Acidocella aminolytica 101 = DSM 11237 TaxID=1120923 RepID=A0A0D6PFA9_9PROT|nr:FAD-dependent oxidoreductase [Acidocella aminolytica]GAN80352.1 FAD dependent pyridine nucleotide-disulfide oxidoreductase [Acidocella aminolytica 101 = DSM 11237]GBQ42934.1 putative NAD/FAD-dependent oxidoreductase [Acidocella aminolytica 101 = DSM 11237]SHE29565.1 NTE family protein [Acidocella aminolytica 101 = DSM 11237]